MSTTAVQVQLDPEYIKWPRACVCCGGLDERDMEIAVPSTDRAEHESDVIMQVHLPYCITCYNHCHMNIPWARFVAVFLALTLVCFFSLQLASSIVAWVCMACIVGFVAYIVYERVQLQRAMKRSCSAARNHVVFVHPTNSRLSTLLFTKDEVARQFREANRYSVVEI